MACAGGEGDGYHVEAMVDLREMQWGGEMLGDVTDAEGRWGGHNCDSVGGMVNG